MVVTLTISLQLSLGMVFIFTTHYPPISGKAGDASLLGLPVCYVSHKLHSKHMFGTLKRHGWTWVDCQGNLSDMQEHLALKMWDILKYLQLEKDNDDYPLDFGVITLFSDKSTEQD